MAGYDWFRVHLKENANTRFSINVTSFLGDPEFSEDFSPPLDEKQADELLSAIENSLEKRKPIGHENLKRTGERLYKSVFSDKIKEYFDRCLKITKRGYGLRVELVIDPLYLRRLPWELMHDGKDFLALSTVTPIVRTILQEGKPPKYDEVSFPLGILFVAASPVGPGVSINVGGEIRRLCMGVSNAVMDGRVHLRCCSAEKIKSQDFTDDVRSGKYHVLHVSSHGAFFEGVDKGFLELEDEQGRAILVSVETLGAWIKDSSIQMVYLDACQTAVGSVRTALSDLSYVFLDKGVGAALAMQFSVPVDTANKFCETFYSQLSREEPIELALSEARKQTVDLVHGLDRIDWAIPALYMNGTGILCARGERETKTTYRPLPGLGLFVGREKKLNELTEDLIDPEVSVISIDGFGGIGKSTIANKLAKDVWHLFADICWIDCRPKTSYDKVIQEINEMLVHNEIGFTSNELANYSPEGKNTKLADALERKDDGFLVVFDNFDSVEDDLDIRNLMQKISEGNKTKVLVTVRIPVRLASRQRFFGLDKLEEDDAIMLMRKLAEDHSIDNIERAKESILKKINARVDGHPKAIEVVIPRLGAEPLDEVLKQLPKVLTRDISPILKWSFKKLSEEEKDFLLEISVYDGDVAYDALKAVHLRDYPLPVHGLVEKNLLSYDTERKLYGLHPLVREFAYSQLRRERRRKLHRLATRYFVSDEVKDPVRAIYHMYDAEDWKAGMHLTSKIFEMLVLQGVWTEARSLCERGLTASRKTEDNEWKRYFCFNLGRMHYRFGNYDEAEKLYKQSMKIDEELGDKSGISKSLHQLAIIQYCFGNYDEAEKLYKQSMKIRQELGDKSGISKGLHELAIIHYHRGNYDEAEKLYKQSMKIDEELGDKSGIALTMGQLGLLFESRNQLGLSKEYYEKALHIFLQIGDKPHAKLVRKYLRRVKAKIKEQEKH